MILLFAIFAGFFPRLATLFIWLARPAMFNSAFNDSFLLPIIGILFLPFTTLMYVVVWSPAGLAGWDWFWVLLAVVLDLSSYASPSYAKMSEKPKAT